MICTQEPSVLTDVRPSASTLSVRRVPDAAVWMDVANASVGALRDPSRPRRSPAYSPSSPAVRGSVAPWPSFADRLPIASRQYARRYELLFGRRLARGAPKPNPAPPYAVLTYELRRRRASLILAEQLRGGLDAVQRRRRPDACGSLLAVASRVRAICSSA